MRDFHHNEQDLDRFRSRTLLSGGLVLLAFVILFGRFFYLQIIQHEYFATRAESNRISLVPIMPNRGNIVDRNGVILARNYSAFTLEITPSKTLGLEETIDSLSQVVEIQLKDRRRFKRLLEESRNFESIPIRTRLSDAEVARFAAQRYRFPGVEVKARLFRQYPEGMLAAHAIGYISRINIKDQEMIDEKGHGPNYKGTEHIGKLGLEAHYEFELHGIAGHEQVEVDAGGRAVRVLSRTPPIPGNNLTLTLDAKLQMVAEQAFGGRRGSLAAIDPTNGAVLGLVSSPAFDPNLFVDGIRFDDWDELNNSPDKPMLNRAIYSTNPPGSTFKPLMALGALATGKRTASQSIADPGFFNFGNRRFMDDKIGGHGTVDMYKSIVVSCNTYYYVLANDMGIDNIARFMGSLGLGRPTEIDIPGEASGILPSAEWKQRRFKKREQQKWYPGETISVGIGQGYNAYSTLHMAHALANVLNYGQVFRPHLVHTITNPTSGDVRVVEPQPVRQIDLKPEHVDVIKRGMAGVVTEGTGARAFAGAAYESGGKTGTAQVFGLKSGQKYVAGKVGERLRDHSWYIAFAPVDKPRIVLAVMVENGGFGSQSAAPIARQVFDYYLTGKLPGGPAPEVDTADAEGDEVLLEEEIDEAD
jgi:penicillin-binding protein 2